MERVIKQKVFDPEEYAGLQAILDAAPAKTNPEALATWNALGAIDLGVLLGS